MKNALLYILTASIWGSTWLAIKFQLGVVDPLLSVAYRFLLSAIILLIYCRLSGRNLRFSRRQHAWLMVQGFTLFGFHYWLVYTAEVYLPSGLVSVVFSTIMFWNVVFGALFLNASIRRQVVFGGFIGILGIILVFKDELLKFSFSSETSVATLICVLAAMIASVGNIVSVQNGRIGIPVFQINAYGMLYGSLQMMLIALVFGKTFTFEFTPAYISSILYLAILGSVVAFSAYLTLIGNIGADKAGYVTLIFPIIALGLSTVFENYAWNALSLLGVALVLMGNLMILQRKKHVG